MSIGNAMKSDKRNDLNNIIKPFFDLNFFFLIIIIILFGLLALTTSSIELSTQKYNQPFYYLYRQIGHLFFSIILSSFLLYFFTTENLKKNYKPLLYISFLLLILVEFFGKTAGGSTRWLSFAFLNIQPSEIFKVLYIVWLCAYLDFNKNNMKKLEYFFIPIICCIFAAFLLYRQPDFGSTAIIFTMTLILLFIAKVKTIHLIILGFFGVLSGFMLVHLKPYMLSRFNIFEPCQNYFSSGLDSGYHLCYSLMAIGSGGIFGKGLGASTSKLFFLPAAHTDFIFAILAEELGIFGIIFLVILFYIFLKKCFFIGNKAIRVGLVFQGYLAYGIGTFISMQAFLNMAVNLGIAPTKGLSLPLFSYGGSNYLASIISIAIIFRIYRDVYKQSINSSIR